MTVSSTSGRITYNGDASTIAFAAPYFLANSDLKVYVGGVLKTLTTDYSVSGAGVSSGGTVTFVAAPPAGTGNVVILRDPDQLQATQLPSNDPFPSKSVETAMDKLTMLVQRCRDLLLRSFVLSDSDSSGASTVVPTPSPLKYLRWNSAGNALESVDIVDMGGVTLPLSVAQGGTGSTSAAAARTALGAGDASQSSIQAQTYTAFTTGGTSTAYTLTPTPAITANTAGQRFRVKFNAAAGASPTLAVSGQSALPLKYKDSTGTLQAIASPQAPINWTADVESDGANWVVLQTADQAHTASAQSYSAAQRGAVLPLTDGAIISPDWPTSNNFRVMLGGNRTLANGTNIVEGQTGNIDIYQDGTGSRTLAYQWGWDFVGGTPPTLSTAAGSKDKLAYSVDVYQAATVTISIATPGVVSWTAHGKMEGQKIQLTTTGALPTGLTASTTYFIKYVDANSFQLAATRGGAAIATSGSQSGTHTCTAISITGVLLADTK